MKTRSSLKSLKKRGSQIVYRKDGNGKRRMFVINKKNPKFKVKQ